MTHIPPRQMVAFVDELSKEAGISDFVEKHLAGRYGRQMLLGAGLGGGLNVLRHRIMDPRPETEGGALDPAMEAARKSNMLKQFVRGAAVGGGLAGGRILATKAGREAAIGKAKDIYEKERYGLTGEGLKGSTATAREMRAQQLGLVGSSPADVEAYRKGYANLPGMLHGLMTNPLDVIRAKKGALAKAALIGGGFGAAKGAFMGPSKEEGGPGAVRSAVSGAAQGAVGALAPATMLAGGMFKALPGRIGAKAKGMASTVGGLGQWAMHDTPPPGRVVPAEQYAAEGGQ